MDNIDETLPFDQDRPVKPQEMQPGLQLWSLMLHAPITVRTVVGQQTALCRTASGTNVTVFLEAMNTGCAMYFHMRSQPNHLQDLRASALRMIDEGNRMLQIIDGLPEQQA